MVVAVQPRMALLGALALVACSQGTGGSPGMDANGGGGSGSGGSVPGTGQAGSGGASSSGGASGAAGTAGAGGNNVAGSGGSNVAGSGGSNVAGSGGSNVAGSGGNTTGAGGMGGALGAFGGLQLGPPSLGGTVTFQTIGKAGSFPSRRDPAAGVCDAYQNGTCCMSKMQIAGDQLTPWDQDLIMTLRGPMIVKQIAVYQPTPAQPTQWQITSAWDARSAASTKGIAFDGPATPMPGFAGVVGSQCLVDVSTDRTFPCGPGSVPYCPPVSGAQRKYYGWEGSKLIIVLASMPRFGSAGAIPTTQNCSNDVANNWHDAPWIGLSHGELVRSGKFGGCHCYAQDPAQWFLGDGCGQFNVFEVVNDNNAYKNLDVFSTNFFGYGGYVGEGPCGAQCNVATLGADVDLINKANNTAAAAGAISTPQKGPGAALRRPAAGYRYFITFLDVRTRTIQVGLIHPERIPVSVAPLLPNLPHQLQQATVDSLLQLRLPR